MVLALETGTSQHYFIPHLWLSHSFYWCSGLETTYISTTTMIIAMMDCLLLLNCFSCVKGMPHRHQKHYAAYELEFLAMAKQVRLTLQLSPAVSIYTPFPSITMKQWEATWKGRWLSATPKALHLLNVLKFLASSSSLITVSGSQAKGVWPSVLQSCTPM